MFWVVLVLFYLNLDVWFVCVCLFDCVCFVNRWADTFVGCGFVLCCVIYWLNTWSLVNSIVFILFVFGLCIIN